MVTKVVPHERLMEEAEIVARQILRNSQPAVRSAKQTILDVIGQPLDFQLRTEAWNAYTCADPEETKALLERFYEKSDAGRAGSARDGAVSRRRSSPGRPRGIGAAIAARLRARRPRRRRRSIATPGCDLSVDLAVDPLPDLGEIDVCVSNAAITDTIAPAHRMTRRAVGRGHRGQPDRRLSRRPGLPAPGCASAAGGGSS